MSTEYYDDRYDDPYDEPDDRYDDPPYDEPDPEQEDAANNHGQDEVSIQQVLGAPKEKAMQNSIKVIARPQRGILASALNIGEFAQITVSGNANDNVGDIVLKTSIGVVNLTKPSVVYPTFYTPQVERLNTGDKLEITVGFTVEFENRIRDIVNSSGGTLIGGKVHAIKAVREATNWSLKESKDYVDAL